MYGPERRETVERAFRGERTGRPLISLWRHWPEQDQDPDALARAHVDFQTRYDFDLVKFTPSTLDVVEDWGGETRFTGDPHGTRDVVKRAIARVDDWASLPPSDFTRSRAGRQLGAIARIRQELGPAVPLFQTVFSPMTVARRLAGERIAEDLRENPAAVRKGLERIASDMLRFVDLSFDAGADGLFFVTQVATHDLLTSEEHRRWGVDFDLPMLKAARKRTELLVLHAHGSNLIFDQLLDYPVPALNWHDRAVGPSLAQMTGWFGGLLMGGLDEWGPMLEGPSAAIREQIREAQEQVGDRPLCIAAGCVIGYRTPDRHIRAARAAVEA